jgi:hypothetical protein
MDSRAVVKVWAIPERIGANVKRLRHEEAYCDVVLVVGAER